MAEVMVTKQTAYIFAQMYTGTSYGKQGSIAQSDACLTGDQEVASSRLRSGPIPSLRLIMKSFLRSFSPFC